MDHILGLMLLLGTIGTADVLYFHLWHCRLFEKPSCRWEVLSHAFHSLASASLFFLCALDLGGRWTLLLGGVAVLEFINLAWDTALETRSRIPLGGVPAGEYRMHAVMNLLWGAVLLTSIHQTVQRWSLGDVLAWRTVELPAPLHLSPWLGIAVGLVLAMVDLWGFLALSMVAPVRSRA